MRIPDHLFEKSRFLSMEKDFAIIIDKILHNQNLCKLLYYTQPDCLKAPNLTPQQQLELIDKQIRIVPKLDIKVDCPNYIVITMDNFMPNANNPEFRDCTISFDILIHPDHWNMGNFELRPYKIAGEIDKMLDWHKLTGIGELQFLSCTDLILNDQLMGLTLTYAAIHGVEDQIDGD